VLTFSEQFAAPDFHIIVLFATRLAWPVRTRSIIFIAPNSTSISFVSAQNGNSLRTRLLLCICILLPHSLAGSSPRFFAPLFTHESPANKPFAVHQSKCDSNTIKTVSTNELRANHDACELLVFYGEGETGQERSKGSDEPLLTFIVTSARRVRYTCFGAKSIRTSQSPWVVLVRALTTLFWSPCLRVQGTVRGRVKSHKQTLFF
jgi:hypothetical protein